ncbi:MAG: VWA domain-containing protein, partial [Muribaculaceae bacterium]|nr:VWA domain-containing protein [Muribaculaceae bacterium]
MEFAHPRILFLLILVPALIAWYIFRRKSTNATLSVSSVLPFAGMRTSLRASLRHSIFTLNMIALSCMIVALARPQTYDSWHNSRVEGTDIVLAMDISTSMLAKDFDPNRLTAAKQVATTFISGRENDNMGLVIFAGESLTAVPLTSDRATLLNYVASINTNLLADGTAIGDGLATAVNRIKGGKAKSKSIILLT